ncbi:MAG: serine hydrolase [Clostridiales bacterium]|nr:serine hydrolase [Clostridiales bacterium]
MKRLKNVFVILVCLSLASCGVVPGAEQTTASSATSQTVETTAETTQVTTETSAPTPAPTAETFETIQATVNPYYEIDPYSFIADLPNEDGITSFGGFEPDEEVLQQLQQASDDLLYRHSFIMIDINTGRGVGYNLDEVYYTASSIKGPFAASFCALAPEIAVDWEDTVISMLQYSDNDAYRVLNDTYHRTYIQEWAAQACVDPAPFAWKYPHISARQMAALWLRNYEFFEQDEWGAQVGSWFESPEYSIINSTVGDLYTTRSKGGWLVDEDPDHAVSIDAGIVYADNGPYVVVIMSRVPSSLAYLGPIMEALEAVHSSM